MDDSPVRIAPVRRIDSRAATADSDLLAVEEPLHLEIEHRRDGGTARLNAGVILRTPGRDEDLVTGLLSAEGLIASAAAIIAFEWPAHGHLRVRLAPGAALDERMARRVLVRGGACGLCGRDAIDDLSGLAPALPPGPAVRAAVVTGLPARLRAHQPVFAETGGLHAAALFDAEGRILASAEDIGRHNAVDKLVGAHLRTVPTAPTVPTILLVSGRAAFEIVHKAVMARIPILAAVGAPSSLAVETARAFDVTLAGFLREDRFNIYSGFDRIV